MSKEIDMTGMKFGRLTILEKTDRRTTNKSKAPIWKCQCDCGNITYTTRNGLRDKASCGCLKSEVLMKRNTKHGECVDGHSRLYQIFTNMKDRCLNVKNAEYKNYGGRGVTICPEWLNNPEEFIKWAKANGYNDSLTIDRIDTNGNYDPTNCRFASMKEQANNTTRNHMVTYQGHTKTLAEWSDVIGISYSTLRNRIYKLKWSPAKAFTQPVRHMQYIHPKH